MYLPLVPLNVLGVIDMIFIPGFSTKEEITYLSGRGVGMDIVRSEIKDLGGSISVSSKLDEGTKFVIKLPVFKWKFFDFI